MKVEICCFWILKYFCFQHHNRGIAWPRICHEEPLRTEGETHWSLASRGCSSESPHVLTCFLSQEANGSACWACYCGLDNFFQAIAASPGTLACFPTREVDGSTCHSLDKIVWTAAVSPGTVSQQWAWRTHCHGPATPACMPGSPVHFLIQKADGSTWCICCCDLWNNPDCSSEVLHMTSWCKMQHTPCSHAMPCSA